MSDIDIAVADSLKVLDLKWPIREATEVVRRCNMSRRAEAVCKLKKSKRDENDILGFDLKIEWACGVSAESGL